MLKIFSRHPLSESFSLPFPDFRLVVWYGFEPFLFSEPTSPVPPFACRRPAFKLLCPALSLLLFFLHSFLSRPSRSIPPVWLCRFSFFHLSTVLFSYFFSLFALKPLPFTLLFFADSFLFASWRITDSNRWPSACKADALASWANPPFYFPTVFRLPCWPFRLNRNALDSYPNPPNNLIHNS